MKNQKYKLSQILDIKKDGSWRHNAKAPFMPFKKVDTDKLLSFFLDFNNDFGVPPICAPRSIPSDRKKESMFSIKLSNFNPKGPRPSKTYMPEQIKELVCKGKISVRASWALLSELANYDYSKTFKNTVDGKELSVKEFLGIEYFKDLKQFSEQCHDLNFENVRFIFYTTQVAN